jgi:iron(III) transport system substrate-binding protein
MSTSQSMLHRTALSLAAFLALAAPAVSGQARAAEEVNVYSYREPSLIDPIFKTFEKETGIKVNVVYSKDGLIERMSAEGRNSPADILITPESGLLAQAKAAGVTQALKSKVLEDAIDAKLRDPEGHWFGLTRRARRMRSRTKNFQIRSGKAKSASALASTPTTSRSSHR